MRKAMSAGRQGFTLIEILISLTIIGLLFGFGFANFRDYSRRQQLLGVARTIKGELRLIQSKASSGEKPDNANCSGTNTLSSYGFQIVSTTSYKTIANCLGGSVDIWASPKELPETISISPSTGTILFKVLGQGTNISAGESFIITLTQAISGNTLPVTISSGGEIK